jgi:hypothetical protein
MTWYCRLLTRSRIREPRSFTQRQLHLPWWNRLPEFFSPQPGRHLEKTHECIHSSEGKRLIVDGTPCDALIKWSYNESTKTWSKPGLEPLQEDKLHELELELADRWDDIVDEAERQDTNRA